MIFVVVAAFGVLAYGLSRFDRFIQLEWERDPLAWEADGKPVGYFWRGPSDSYLGGRWARQRLAWSLLFQTPTWAEESPPALECLAHFRFCAWVWNATVVSLVLFSLLRSSATGT